MSTLDIHGKQTLLKLFNDRDHIAFGRVYALYYNQLLHLTRKLFEGTPHQPDDIIQDIFINVWENRNRKFLTLDGIKLYLYVSIKNRFQNHIVHQKYVDKYRVVQLSENKFITQVVETETLSLIAHALNMLPTDYAEIFRMHIEGWNIKEIAEKLGRPESTIYRQKQEASSILRKKLKAEELLILMPLLFL